MVELLTLDQVLNLDQTFGLTPVVQAPPLPTREGFRESLDRADEVGTRVFFTQDGQAFATSNSNPDLVYRVGFNGCECTGFQHRGRCAHLAAYVRYLVNGY